MFQGFVRGMEQLGFHRGDKLEIWAGGGQAEPSRRIHEMLAWKPEVILVRTSWAAKLVQSANAEIPIVFSAVDDPVAEGLVDSLARPGRNATGVAALHTQLAVKRLELLHEALPSVRRVTALFDSTTGSGTRLLGAMRPVAARLKLALEGVDTGGKDLTGALARISGARPDLVLICGFIDDEHYFARLLDFQKASRIPVVDDELDAVRRGVFMGLGEDISDLYGRVAAITAKILLGRKPGDIPVETATIMRFAVNARAARELGVKLPPTTLIRADLVVQ